MSLPLSPGSDLVAAFRQGFAWHQAGETQKAAAIYREILNLQPLHFDALHLLGVIHMQRGDAPEAATLITKAITIDDGQAPAFINLGIVRAALKQFPVALESFDRAVALMPANAEAHYNRGNTLREMKRTDEALASFDQALVLKPDHADALISRGGLLRDLGRTDEALRDLNAAIAVTPASAVAHYNRGTALKDLNRLADAEVALRAAIERKPDFAEAHVALAECLLLMGQAQQGWREYDWRWRTSAFAAVQRSFTQPLWDGRQDIAGKTILVHAEQGLGDTIHFCRYAGLLAARRAQVILEVQAPLKSLLSDSSGVHHVIGAGEPLPAFDFQCPLLSLPLALGDATPPDAAYIKPDERVVAQWRARLGSKTKPRIGLVWSGSATHGNDRNRSLALDQFAELASAPVALIGLQKDVRATDVPALALLPNLTNLGPDLNDFADTAALIANLDLVISVDTATAHVAAAMGQKTWILLPFAPDWRWGLDREDTPWYPSARLFRQPKPGDWASVIATLARDLARFTF